MKPWRGRLPSCPTKGNRKTGAQTANRAKKERPQLGRWLRRKPRPRNTDNQLLVGVATEERVRLPLGGRGIVGRADKEAPDDFFVESGGLEVDGLFGVV